MTSRCSPRIPRTTGASTSTFSPEHGRHDPVHRLGRDLLPVIRAVRHPDAGVEQPEVVVDLGDRPDRRAGISASRPLFDGDRGREPLDGIDVRFVHLAEELAGVRRKALDVATLALGVDRVKGERGLPRTGKPSKYH